jgi:DNA-binding transcriptional LysR family regulator
MLNELRALAVFAQIVESGSIRAAARVLGLSPSVVSHHLRALEQRAGATLLYRTTRKLALTPAGQQLAGEAQAMVACAERGLDGLRGAGATMRGALRVTMPGFLAATRLPSDLAEYAREHPSVSLSVNLSELPRDLLADGFDLALRLGPLSDSSHEARLLGHMDRALVVAAELYATMKRPRTPEDLAHWPFIHLGSRAPSLLLRHERSGEEIEVRYASRLVADSAVAIRAMMLAGAGVATLPRALVVDELRQGSAVELLGAWKLVPIPLRAVWPHATVKAALTHHFLEFVAPRLAALFPARTARKAG